MTSDANFLTEDACKMAILANNGQGIIRRGTGWRPRIPVGTVACVFAMGTHPLPRGGTDLIGPPARVAATGTHGV